MLSQPLFESIPNQLTLKIFSYLDLQTIYTVQLVNSTWHQIVEDSQVLWKKKSKYHYPHLENNQNWSLAYQTASKEDYHRLLANKKTQILAKLFPLVKEGHLANLEKMGNKFKLEMLDEIDKDHNTLLDWANIKNHQALLDYFYLFAIKQYSSFAKPKINLKKTDAKGRTILHWAVGTNQPDQVNQLILQKCDVNAVQADPPLDIDGKIGFKLLITSGITPLHIAAAYGRINIVKMLLDAGACIDGVDGQIHTPLHLAVINEHEETVNFLLAKKANVNKFSSDGRAALHLAAQHHNINILETLLNNGANVELNDFRTKTPLAIAAQHGQLEIIRTLLKRSADINGSSPEFSPLHVAVEYDQDKAIPLLLENGADFSKSFPRDTHPPHLVAAENDSIKTIEFLLKTYKPNARLLYAAAVNGHDKIIKILIKAGVNVNDTIRRDNDNTVLHLIAKLGHSQGIKTMLENGANINAIRSDGATPLLIAAENKKLNAVKTLLENDADMNLARNDGETPLSIAKKNKHDEIVKILKTHSMLPVQSKNLSSKVKHMIFGQGTKRNNHSSENNHELQTIQRSKDNDDEDNNSRQFSPYM